MGIGGDVKLGPIGARRVLAAPGRARRKPLKPLRAGMPGDPGATVVTTVCFLPLHTGRGCNGHPAFPAPSFFRAKVSSQSSGASRRGALTCVCACNVMRK